METSGASVSGILGHVLPPTRRKSPEEVSDQLDLSSGDRTSKQSAFWTMLVLAAVIATAGVIGDSTATVIGAMIIAPLGTPIMGMALGVVLENATTLRHSALFVVLGSAAVVSIGVIGSLALPSTTELISNPQIASRTAPTLVDLVAAIATGFAGAVGLARRDVSDVLPGVAIAISLVPPLAVVGICLGQWQPDLALGALLLFASNVLAMVLAGMLTFTVAFRIGDSARQAATSRRRYLAIGTLMVLIIIPLALNTASTILINTWTSRVHNAATDWLAAIPKAEVLDVTFASRTAVISVLTPADLPPTSDLVDSLKGKVPSGVKIVIDGARGERESAGSVP